MGNKSSSSAFNTHEVLEQIAHPENEAQLRTLFAKFDKNASGSLDRAEWNEFGKFLYKADVENAVHEGRQEVADTRSANRAAIYNQMHGGALMQFADRSSTKQDRHMNYIETVVKPHDIDAWISNMFTVADKDGGGSITFEEFWSFLNNESKKEAATHKQNFQLAMQDPQARMQAMQQQGPLGPRLIKLPVNAVFVSGSPLGQMMDRNMNGQYVPGQLPEQIAQLIHSHPGMSAFYAKNPEVVRELVAKGHNPNAQQQILDANPELKTQWGDMMMSARTSADPQMRMGMGF